MSQEMKEFKIKLIKLDSIGNYYIFDFEKPSELTFEEGQYGIFQHVDKEIEGRKMRAFSIASSTDEDFLRIATKIVENPSDFKQKMRTLQVGDVMSYTGPVGDFTLESEYSAVFIAGGIGITPIRSMLRKTRNDELSIKSFLIYSEADGVYPFNDEFIIEKSIQTTVEDTVEAIKNAVKNQKSQTFYYISGSPGFVNGVSELLISLGIDKKRIKFDRFSGYDTILKIKA